MEPGRVLLPRGVNGELERVIGHPLVVEILGEVMPQTGKLMRAFQMKRQKESL